MRARCSTLNRRRTQETRALALPDLEHAHRPRHVIECRVRHALEWRKTVGGKVGAPDAAFPSMFAATERLLTRRMSPEVWAARAEDRDVALLQEYLRPKDMDACAAAAHSPRLQSGPRA